MDRLNNTTTQRKSKHLNYEKRIKIEALYKSGMKIEEIGRLIKQQPCCFIFANPAGGANKEISETKVSGISFCTPDGVLTQLR